MPEPFYTYNNDDNNNSNNSKKKKDKILKEYLRRTRKLLETKLSSRNLTKGINTWLCP